MHQDGTYYQSAEQFYVDQRQETSGSRPNFGDPQISAFKRVSSYKVLVPASPLETEYQNLPSAMDAEEQHVSNGLVNININFSGENVWFFSVFSNRRLHHYIPLIQNLKL